MSHIDHVNVLQGTKSTMRFSHGNIRPLVQLPFAMASYTLQTDGERGNWYFDPDSTGLEGIRLTRQLSPWVADYGTMLFMPQTDHPMHAPDTRWSDYDPKMAVLRPDQLQVTFIRSRAQLHLVPTRRGGICRVTFAEKRPAYMSFFFPEGESHFEWDEARGRLYASTTAHSGDDTRNFRMHMVVEFPAGAVNAAQSQVSTGEVTTAGTAIEGTDVGIHLALNTTDTEWRMAISYISRQQAEENLRQDMTGETFDTLRSRATAMWEDNLSLIEVETETEEQLRTFYSCLYRCLLYPHEAYETDSNGRDIHFVPATGGVAPGRRYTDTCFWDTFRTQMPLLSIIRPDIYRDMVEAFVGEYTDGGWLPRLPSIGEVGCMPSTLVDGVLADAAVKGLMSEKTMKTALKGMLHHANVASPDDRHGRTGVEEYCCYGYVPSYVPGHSVNLTLDAAYGDHCAAVIAGLLGDQELAAIYRRRGQNYRNLFDPATGFMRAKNADGQFVAPFDPIEWGGPYCEANAWQTTFFVPHDVEGLAALFGGREAMAAKLDALFAEAPGYRIGDYGRVIHEMAEAVAVNLGQCAMNNQPSFHIPFLYAALGMQEKTDYWVERICRTLFSSRPDGYPGDEDNGSMAAWYIFAMLGFYPLCPGSGHYVRTRMLAKKAAVCGRSWDSATQPASIPHTVFDN